MTYGPVISTPPRTRKVALIEVRMNLDGRSQYWARLSRRWHLSRSAAHCAAQFSRGRYEHLRQGIQDCEFSNGYVVDKPDEYVENAPKDMVTALPGQVIGIKATFDKPARYAWHCHILSHEDHEMMRVLYIGAKLQKIFVSVIQSA